MIHDITRRFKTHCETLLTPDAVEMLSLLKLSPQTQFYSKYFCDLQLSLNKIRQILEQSRENYFSNPAYSYSAFTDMQRNEFDATVRRSLQNVSKEISSLKENVDKVYFRNKTETEHMKAVMLCLFQFYRRLTLTFSEFHLHNQRKKIKLIQAIEFDVTPQQKQYLKVPCARKMEEVDEDLEREAELLILQRVSEEDRLKDTQKTLENISEVLQQMSHKVLEQELLTSSFMSIGEVGLFHIEKGNRNLVEANELSKQSGRWWSWLFVLLGVSLLILDFIKG